MTSFLPRRRPEIAIDFGTANIRVLRRGDGLVFDEPSLCCIAGKHGLTRLYAAGSEAYAMVDRTPANLRIARPLCRGVLQDIDAAKGVLRYALSKSMGRSRWRAPAAIIGVPADATEAERGAMLTAANDAGLGPVTLLTEPLAAAMGAGLPIDNPTASMVVECGAGTTEVAVFSLGGQCAAGSVRIGGETLNRALADEVHLRHKFLIGERSAEQFKLDYVANRESGNTASARISVSGRCLRMGLPKTILVEMAELDRVVERHVAQIVKVVRDVLGQTAPDLSQDIHDKGILLTGGSALIPLMRSMISEATGLQVMIAQDPSQCVAKGLDRLLNA